MSHISDRYDLKNLIAYSCFNENLGQHRSCWCPGTCRCQGISSCWTDVFIERRWVIIEEKTVGRGTSECCANCHASSPACNGTQTCQRIKSKAAALSDRMEPALLLTSAERMLRKGLCFPGVVMGCCGAGLGWIMGWICWLLNVRMEYLQWVNDKDITALHWAADISM